MNTKPRKSAPGEGPTLIDVEGQTVTAMPFDGDWLIRGTEQDRLTAVFPSRVGESIRGGENVWGVDDLQYEGKCGFSYIADIAPRT